MSTKSAEIRENNREDRRLFLAASAVSRASLESSLQVDYSQWQRNNGGLGTNYSQHDPRSVTSTTTTSGLASGVDNVQQPSTATPISYSNGVGRGNRHRYGQSSSTDGKRTVGNRGQSQSGGVYSEFIVAAAAAGISERARRQSHDSLRSRSAVETQIPCDHTPQARQKVAAVKAAKEKTAKDVATNLRIRLLQEQLKVKKSSLEGSLKREKTLIDDSLKIKSLLEQDESISHDGVKQLLRKYERFRGGMANLSNKHGQEVSEAERRLDETRDRISEELSEIESKVAFIDNQLKPKQAQLLVLRNYENREFQKKSFEIDEAQQRLNDLKSEQQEEYDTIGRVGETELQKLKRTQASLLDDLIEIISQTTVDKVDHSIQDMALQNKLMLKEIELHTREISKLEECTHLLRKELNQLLKQPRTVREVVYPHLISSRPKCTPEMELKLDIPTQTWLPI